MKANYGKMIVGVIIGIMATTTLTLNIWGAEWYKLITSTVAGLIIGLLISDHQTTITIFKTGLQTAINNSWRRAQRIKNGEITPEEQHKFDILVIKLGYALISVMLGILMMAITVIMICCLAIFYPIPSWPIFLTFAAIFISMLRGYLLLINSFEFDDWAKKLNEVQIKEIWNKEPSETTGKNSLTYDYIKKVKIDFKELTVGMSRAEIISRAKKSAKLTIKHSLKRDREIIKETSEMIILLVFTIFFFVVTSLPMSPFWLIKQISKHGHLLNVAAAITIGSMIGTLVQSQLMGIASGLIFLAIGYLVGRFIKQIDLLYVFREGRLWQKTLVKIGIEF